MLSIHLVALFVLVAIGILVDAASATSRSNDSHDDCQLSTTPTSTAPNGGPTRLPWQYLGCYDQRVFTNLDGGGIFFPLTTSECISFCQGGAASNRWDYAYYYPDGHRCYCIADHPPSSVDLVEAISSNGTCENSDVGVYNLNDDFAFRRCYATTPHKVVACGNYTDIESCFDACTTHPFVNAVGVIPDVGLGTYGSH
nr:uncharacterized protein CI109_003310 [Kwoniella shandongensis]KAA5528410.1 hypothetical protein CI109_003310 [Kwoniella shandongensis]